MLANLDWLGLNIGSVWGRAPTTQEGWAITVFCLTMLLVASIVVGRMMRFLIAVSILAVLTSIGFVTGIAPG